MKRLGSLIFAALSVSIIGAQQTARTFEGTLERQLSVDTVHIYKRVWSAADLSTLKLSPAPEKGSVISGGDLIDVRKANSKSRALLVEPSAGNPYFWIDTDENGTYEASEKFPAAAAKDDPNYLSATLKLPIKNAYYSSMPVFIHYFKGSANPKLKAGDRLIEQSVYSLAKGHVNINGRKVLFQYFFDPTKPAISTTEGLFGVDANGDGKIRDEQFSPETSYAASDEIVMPLGDIFVSTSSIDMATGKIVVRQRDKSEYHRVDLEVGRAMPDFAFTDLDGKERHLSDFRGKYLMVDFWGVWCGDCTRETPFHLEAYKRFKDRGFEILGLDSDQKIETLKAYLEKNKMTWPQATNDSTQQLASVTYRIQEYPSTILLGPDGKVLVLDQHKLQGPELLETLESIIPK